MSSVRTGSQIRDYYTFICSSNAFLSSSIKLKTCPGKKRTEII